MHHATDTKEAESVLKDAKKLSQKCCTNQLEKKMSAEKYVRLMNKSLTQFGGIESYLKNEKSRLQRLLQQNISEEKKSDVSKTLNIVKSFQSSMKYNKVHGEL